MFRVFTMALAGLLFALPVSAHEPRDGPHGGRLVDAGTSWHLELVATGVPEVTAYLSDAQDKPISAGGFRAQAILVVDGKAVRFALEPAADNRLVGRAPVPVPRGVKGAVQLTAPDGSTAQAKF
ncbi:MAG: hypothetical protein FJX02_05030 [Alphaproteobacteria bacterium]|nr:hypothetical protein [Alphaproteobacteria bacterium]